jgi:hypothetical protein
VLAEADEFVEVTCRYCADRKLWFMLNHYQQAKSISGLRSGVELLSGQPCSGQLQLPPYGVAFVEVRF